MEENYHFIGIGGIGMSALARLLVKRGSKVSGSDQSSSDLLNALEQEGVSVHIGHKRENVPEKSFIVYTNGLSEANPELLFAKENNCTLLHRSQLLAYLMKEHFALTVAGTHGKTTTSSLLSHLLLTAEMEPSFAIGGILKNIGLNAYTGNLKIDQKKYFVAEADESDGSFLNYPSQGSIITNIDTDHMNYYKTVDNLTETFTKFLNQVENPEHLFWCIESPLLKKLNPKGFSYGFSKEAALVITKFIPKANGVLFNLSFQEKEYENIFVPLLGEHNALNAAAVFGLGLSLKIPEEVIKKAFSSFQGVKRRMDIKYNEKSLLVIDDYAHHPTEVKATLNAIRSSIEERRLLVIFQPHRFTRTEECMEEFATSFQNADHLFLLPIYSAGEAAIEGISSAHLREKICNNLKNPTEVVENDLLFNRLKEILRPHDVVVFMGAGSVTKMADTFSTVLKDFSVEPLKVALLFGGKSRENSVSCVSAEHVLNSLDKNLYKVTPLYITEKGEWINKTSNTSFNLSDLSLFDVAFPVFHGPYGEDGSLQGLFETLGLPYVGCDFRAAAIAMDKALTKKILLAEGISTLPFLEVCRFDWEKGFSEKEKNLFLEKVENTFSFPVFIKAVHLGSSIGVYKATTLEELQKDISNCFAFDDKLIIEPAVAGRELEFAVFGNHYLHTFPPGEVLTDKGFYDFDAKYGENGMKTNPVAILDPELQEEGMLLAKKIYTAIGCQGWARVDFFLDSQKKWWCNEVNPIPGCTPISLYPKICIAAGFKFSEIVDRFIFLALEKARNTLEICKR